MSLTSSGFATLPSYSNQDRIKDKSGIVGFSTKDNAPIVYKVYYLSQGTFDLVREALLEDILPLLLVYQVD